jgi:hypothetical protein
MAIAMDLELDRAVEVLERTPATLRALLSGLSDSWTHTSGEPDAWSPYVIVGHLIHADETDWIPRAEIILRHGESRPFEPFDRFAQLDRFHDQPLDRLLDLFAKLRREKLAELRAMKLGPAQLELRGRHPALGVVTLRQLITTWVVHDLGHIAQATRVMSKHYDDAVGPWKAYLPILTR